MPSCGNRSRNGGPMHQRRSSSSSTGWSSAASACRNDRVMPGAESVRVPSRSNSTTGVASDPAGGTSDGMGGHPKGPTPAGLRRFPRWAHRCPGWDDGAMASSGDQAPWSDRNCARPRCRCAPVLVLLAVDVVRASWRTPVCTSTSTGSASAPASSTAWAVSSSRRSSMPASAISSPTPCRSWSSAASSRFAEHPQVHPGRPSSSWRSSPGSARGWSARPTPSWSARAAWCSAISPASSPAACSPGS